MIGIFDSWFGWLQTMKYFQEKYPQYDYLFLADSKNCPYGSKSGGEIKKLTYQGLNWLFNNGADIVILACNTAAAYSVRARQEEFPQKKVLSITIPGIEKILENKRDDKTIGVLATQATILSNIYTDIFLKLGGQTPRFQGIIASDLVDLIESWFEDKTHIQSVVNGYLSKFDNIDHLILWCTHFPVLIDYFRKWFSGEIIDPSKEAAEKFGLYLEHHPEIREKLTIWSTIRYLTTGDTFHFETVWQHIWGAPIKANHIEIDSK